MGMDPVTQAAIIGAIGRTAGGIFAPQGQQLSSFENAGSLDPHATLSEAQNMLRGVFGGALARAGQPVDLSHAYVQDLPSFTGGGLPMPIGATGSWNKNAPAASSGGTGGTSSLFAPQMPPGTVAGQTRGPGPGNPDPSDPGGSGLPDNSPGNGNYPLGTEPRSLLSGLDDAMGSPASMSTGPVRRTPQMPGDPSAPSIDVSGNGGGDTRALGAVSLLLHLAKEQNQQQPNSPQQRAV